MATDAEQTYENEDIEKITSISEYITTISEVRNKLKESGQSSSLFFRGQSSSLWDIRPSIYRDSLVSVEDEIIQRAISRVPSEFSLTSDFEILTKLQHYGLPTRLLDVTMNPLVSLYFACCTKEYANFEGELKETDGVVFHASAYAADSGKQGVCLLSAIAKEKLDGKCTLQELKDKLNFPQIEANRLISLLQNNYFVMPNYSNSRIICQSGAFLLSGTINVSENEDNIWESKVQKSTCNLNDEFDQDIIIIDAEAKESILDELDFLNINEGSLFPELEHQMSHVKRIGAKRIVEFIPKFIKYDDSFPKVVPELDDIASGTLKDKEIEDIIGKNVKDKNIVNEILKEVIDVQNFPDWYKKDSMKSTLQSTIKRILVGKKKKNAKETAFKIVQNLINQIR